MKLFFLIIWYITNDTDAYHFFPSYYCISKPVCELWFLCQTNLCSFNSFMCPLKTYRVFIKYCVFFEDFLKFSGLMTFSVFPRCQCVYTHQAGRTLALQQNWQSLEKFQNFKEKTQLLMNTLYILLLVGWWGLACTDLHM